MQENGLVLYYDEIKSTFLTSLTDVNRKIGDIDIRTLVKEIGQNSLDASSSNEPVEIEFNLIKIPRNKKKKFLKEIGLTQIEEIKKNLELMANYDLNESARFSKMIRLLESNESDTYFLVISDYNTYGLTGSDVRSLDERSRFQGYNYRLGLSEKRQKLGSYGEGRLAALSTSQLQYVFEISNLAESWKGKKFRKFGLGIHGIFQDSENKIYSGVFFVCKLEDGNQVRSLMLDSINNESVLIPEKRKEKTGTTFIFPFIDLEIILKKSKGEKDDGNLENIFLQELNKNIQEIFFMSLINRELTVNIIISRIENEMIKIIKEKKVESERIQDIYHLLATKFSDDSEKEKIINQHECLLNIIEEKVDLNIPQGRAKPRLTEKLNFRLLEIDRNCIKDDSKEIIKPLLNKIIFARNGMVIEHKDFRIPCRTDYIGILNVEKEKNEEAHEFLRSCEPVKHDMWNTSSPRLLNKYGKRAGPDQLNSFFKELESKIKKHFGYDETDTNMLSDDIREELFRGMGIKDINIDTAKSVPYKSAQIVHKKFKELKKRKKSVDIGGGFIVKSEQKEKIEREEKEEKITKPQIRKKYPISISKIKKNQEGVKEYKEDVYRFNLIPKLIKRTERKLVAELYLPEDEEYVKNISIYPQISSYDKMVKINLERVSLKDKQGADIDVKKKCKKDMFPLNVELDLNNIPTKLREKVKIELSVKGER